MRQIAAHLLDVSAEVLEIAPGVVRRRDDPSVQVSIQAVFAAAFLGHPLPPGVRPGLEATAYFDPPASAFGYGTVAAQVEVDPRSGEFEIQRYVLVHDCGTQVNPMIVEAPGLTSRPPSRRRRCGARGAAGGQSGRFHVRGSAGAFMRRSSGFRLCAILCIGTWACEGTTSMISRA